jgi:hypothetical protein
MSFSPLAGAVLALAAAPWCASAQDSFTVVVCNHSGAPRSIVELASKTASRAFLAIRIESRWIVSEPTCHQALLPGPIVQAFVMPRLQMPLPGGGHPAGYAMPEGFPHPRVYALWDAARDAADRTQRPIQVVLGCILIHEAGHLLGLAHQSHGVMRANLEGVDMDETTMGRPFNSEEANRLRTNVKQLGGLGAARLILPGRLPFE